MILYPIIARSGSLEGDTLEVQAVCSLARSLPSQMVEANIALNHFLSCVSERSLEVEQSSEIAADAWQRTSDERRDIERLIRERAGVGENDQIDQEQISIRVDVELLRRKLKSGEEPKFYAFYRPFVFAKAFVFGLDRIHKILGQCRHYTVSQVPAMKAIALLDERLPDLKEFRNSLAHFEDRVRGKHLHGKKRKDIKLQPLDTPSIKVDSGALILEYLEGDVFRGILADGSFGAIPIRGETLEVIQVAVQDFLDTLPWAWSHAHLVPPP